MSGFLRVSFHLLDERFHGRGGEAAATTEWPPSPFRAWQALVAAAGALRRSGEASDLDAALRALERAPHPVIVAPRSVSGSRVPTYVPNNAGDLVGRSRGEKTMAELRTAKLVATRTLEPGPVCYLWPEQGLAEHLPAIQQAARAVAFLGWGMDLAVGDADLVDESAAKAVPGERWLPSAGGASRLRVPREGSLAALDRRHAEFLARMSTGELAPPAPVSAFDMVAYAREGEHEIGSIRAFLLRRLDGRGMASFDPARAGLRVAGMTRGAAHAAARAQGLPEAEIRARVLGHEEGGGHLAYVPLPTIEHRGDGMNPVIGAVRRVLIVASGPEAADAVRWAAEGLAGADLVDEVTGEVRAVLEPVGADDAVVRQYLDTAAVWSTVTPVHLPGHDDKDGMRRRLQEARTSEDSDGRRALQTRLDARVERLLRKAIVQAGFGTALATHAALEWQEAPFLRGATRADRYGVPSHARGARALHVRIRWRDEKGNPIRVRGPIVLGRSRFAGGGLFAPE